MIHVLYDQATGAAHSIGSVAPATIPDGLALFSLDVPYATLGDYTWDATARALVERAPVVITTMSVLTFASRWTLPEQVALDVAEETHPDPTVRATIRVAQRTLDRANDVSVTDPRTVQGTDTLLDVLVGAGVLTPETRATRRAAILAPLSPAEMMAQAQGGA